MTDPRFVNINRLFVQSFEAGENDPARNCFVKYYMPLLGAKDVNASIDNEPFFWSTPTINKKRLKKLLKVTNDDYPTRKLTTRRD